MALPAYQAHKRHALICVLASPTRLQVIDSAIQTPCFDRKAIAFRKNKAISPIIYVQFLELCLQKPFQGPKTHTVFS